MRNITLLLLLVNLGLCAQNWNTTSDNTSTGSLTIGSNNTNEDSKLTLIGPNNPVGVGSKRDISFEFNGAGKTLIRSYRGSAFDTSLQFLTTDANSNEEIERLHINGNGKIGIGTTTPSSHLEIANTSGGELSVSTNKAYGTDTAPLRPSIYFKGFNDSKKARIFATEESLKTNGSRLVFMVNDGTDANSLVERMTILKNGNIGINISNPENTLSVNGSLWAQSIKVRLHDGADWVFEEDYNLRPLKEVEAYIKAHKHLPEIPSAEDFRKNDLEVSQMTNKLLQKIEELTLYTIEQEKLLETQKTKNKELESRLVKLEQLITK